jgi:hypothetical protein
MSKSVEYGTVDGHPAKIVRYPERGQMHIFWGGMEKPDGIGHNHMTVQDSNPEAVHFLQQNGQIVVNHNYKQGSLGSRRQDVAQVIGPMLVQAWRRVLRWYGMGGRR